MGWVYNADTDTLTVRYDPSSRAASIRKLAGGVVEYDERGAPVRVRLLKASRHCAARELRGMDAPHRPGETLHTIPAAARILGIPPFTLRRAVLAGAVPIVKKQSSWCVRPGAVAVYRQLLALVREAGKP